MSSPETRTPVTSGDWIKRGQLLEAQETGASLPAAVECFDRAIALLPAEKIPDADERTYSLGVAWMNRGNALRKQSKSDSLGEAVRSYDEAIAKFSLLPIDLQPRYRNSLGSVWMNRGHALLQRTDGPDPSDAVAAFEKANEILGGLPLQDNSRYRLNLAGAKCNLAIALLETGRPDAHARARELAGAGLRLVADREVDGSEFAHVGLMLRRALCDALGRLAFAARDVPDVAKPLIGEATEVVESGLELVRRWEKRGATVFRPLAARLFYFGAQLYRINQPQFLAEFVLECLDTEQPAAALAATPELCDMALEQLSAARQALATQPVPPNDVVIVHMLRTSRELTRAQERVEQLRQECAGRAQPEQRAQ